MPLEMLLESELAGILLQQQATPEASAAPAQGAPHRKGDTTIDPGSDTETSQCQTTILARERRHPRRGVDRTT